MPSREDLCFRAGPQALAMIRDGGFRFDDVAACFGPAGGPRWLVSSGFDLALLENRVLGRTRTVLLAGSSAGAWRYAAWIQPEPLKSYRALREAYIDTDYGRKDTPRMILQGMRAVLDGCMEDDAIPFALANRRYRLAVFTVRGRHLLASEIPGIRYAGFALAFLGNALGRSHLSCFAERVVFYTGPKPPSFCFRPGFTGRCIPLSTANFKHAILASGAIPLVVAGVRDIFGAPRGTYRDGGLVDYHLTHPYAGEGEITLFFHHQARNVPGWMDKRLPKRRAAPEVMDRVLMVYPSEPFVSSLPRGKIPDRDDFAQFVDAPETRKEIWREAVRRSAHFGEVFLEAVAGGRLRDRVRPLDP